MQVKRVEKREIIYSQGDVGKTVIYIQKGGAKLSAITQTGKEAVVAILGSGSFIGEKCLSGCLVRRTTAIAITPSTLIVIGKNEMRRVLRTKHPFCDVFISYLLARNLRSEEDLIDSLCNSSEVRLARVLIRLAEQGDHDKVHAFAEISQGTLARMIGTTRPRVNFFMKRFRKRGFISYTRKFDGTLKRNDGLLINTSLLTAVLDE
jgi:CRP-like cAMP-binding protein